MKKAHRIAWLSAILLAGMWTFSRPGSAGDSGSPRQQQTKADKLIVHEWGTFTNFSGSNGLQLEFRPLLDEELPAFVKDRTWTPLGLLLKSSYTARQRMETPVTYFYTDRPRDVDVRVDFPQGLLTEFYPPVQKFGPPFNRTQPAKIADSYLDWGSIRLLPQEHFHAIAIKQENGKVWRPSLPTVEGDNHYAYARETDSAVVQFNGGLGGTHYEKFLFYRGLGTFSLPLRLEALGQGRFQVTNSGHEPVRSLFLVQVEDGRIHFTQHPELKANGTLRLEQSSTPSTTQDLGEAVVAELLKTGLYEKEARSMVKTWQSSWFGEQGTRLFYVLPSSQTDAILPLTISPPPDEVVRVLVGRMEVLTPEQAGGITAALASLGTCVTLQSEPLISELARLGRFAEPALASMLGQETNPERRHQISDILAQLRERREARPLK